MWSQLISVVINTRAQLLIVKVLSESTSLLLFCNAVACEENIAAALPIYSWAES